MAPWSNKLIRAAILVGGLLATEFILFGPSLIGKKILLPMDVLGQPNMYLSPSQSAAWGPPWDPILTDAADELELDRRFSVSELRAGRLPLWNPHEYCGQPFVAANATAVFSPFRLLDLIWPGPGVIAWEEVLKTMVAGIGAYLFFRRAMGTDFLPALIGGWIWPLCGYYIQWAGHPQSGVAAWLPWLFLFTDGTLRRPLGFSGAGLAISSALSLVSGHSGTAGQILLADGVFFLWRAFDLYRWRALRSGGAAMVIVAWVLGAMLSAEQSLPTYPYLQRSHRMAVRVMVGSETRPVGLIAVPQLVLPDFNGCTRGGAVFFGWAGNLPESASTGYVGLISGLVLAPLGLCNRRRWGWLGFSAALAIVGMGQILGVPGLKQLYDSFPLNAFRENRMVIATGWAIMIAAVVGLETIEKGLVRRRVVLGFAAVPIALGVWCFARAFHLPQALSGILDQMSPRRAESIAGIFQHSSIFGGGVCAIGAAIWAAIALGLARRRGFAWAIGILAVMDVLVASYNVYPQTDPSMYYPPQSILRDLAQAPPGRVVGVDCFPACLPESAGLLDVRGYDGADPQRLVDLAYLTQPKLFANPNLAGARMMDYYPAKFPSPITRIMNLRYLIFTGAPPPGRRALFRSEGYWVYEDRHCLPRVFVPKAVRVIDDPTLMLRLIDSPDFDPSAVAFVDPPAAPPTEPASGEAKITDELPCHVTIQYDMKTPGMIVLSDTWDEGWHARVSGVETPVLRANYLFRGVMAPAGKGILQFDYEPASFYLGLKLAAAAGVVLLGWCGVAMRVNSHKRYRDAATVA